MKRLLKSILAVTTIAASTSALAAPGAEPFDIRGSDTLFEIMTDAFAQYNTQCASESWQKDLTYVGTGSGNAEKATFTRSSSFSGNWQVMAPMSRNLTESAGAYNANFAPELRNVLGLDAGVFVQKGQGTGYTACRNFTVNAGALNNFVALVLAGKDGAGTREACRDPDRLAAIETLRSCYQGVLSFNHFYRRDDNSGTTDTFRDKLHIDRFCNGKAGGASSLNTSNEDLDPIRTDCPAGDPVDPLHSKVRCTFTDPADTAHFGQQCQDTPFEPGCTAGFVIALSQGDPGIPDITTTIGLRVGNDDSLSSIGYAGREAARLPGRPASGPKVDNQGFIDDKIQGNVYLLSRRLWLNDRIVQQGVSLNPDVVCTDADSTGLPVDANHPTGFSGCTAGRDITEGSQNDTSGVATGFFFWATDTLPQLGCANGLTGRQIMGPILRTHGFLSCLPGDGEPIEGDASNLCSLQDGPSGFYLAGPSSVPSLVVNTVSGGAYQPTTCNTGTICWSNGAACPGTCPVPAAKPAGWVCSADAECSSGTCDPFARACL